MESKESGVRIQELGAKGQPRDKLGTGGQLAAGSK